VRQAPHPQERPHHRGQTPLHALHVWPETEVLPKLSRAIALDTLGTLGLAAIQLNASVDEPLAGLIDLPC